MNWDNCEEPKKLLIVALIGLTERITCGMMLSLSSEVMRSLGDLFHAEEAHAQLRGEQFTDAANTLVFKVVDVVGRAFARIQVDM